MRKLKLITLVTALIINSVASADLNTGLVAHWSFDSNTQDSSNNHLDGVGYGTLNYVAGISGQAIKFDGVSTYINAGNSVLFNVNQHSIVAWIDITNSNSYGTLIGKVNPFTFETLSFGFDKSGEHISTGFATNNEVNHLVINSKVIAKSKWHQVAITYNGAVVSFYIDGILTNKTPRTGTLRKNTNDLAIGRHGGDSLGNDGYFNGLMDEVSIYNRALSSSEIKSLYQQVIPPVVKGTVDWTKPPYSVQCVNNTTVQSIVIPKNTTANYDCEKAGLVIKSGDDISVTVSGKKY